MKKVIYILVLVSTVFLVGCKKESIVQASRMDMLTGRKWKIDKLLYSVKGDPAVLDYTSATYKKCELDDIYEFNKGGTFIRSDGFNLCSNVSLYGPYGKSNWSADSAVTRLDIELSTRYSYKFKVVNLSTSQLQLERSTVDYLQQEVLYTFYFQVAN